MEIELYKASVSHAEEIWRMQIIECKPLLEKYQNYDKSPGNEKLEKTVDRIN